jgi:hypothetical protein
MTTQGAPLPPTPPPGEVRLVPLDCPSCGAALTAREQDVVYYCSGCRNGYRLADPDATGSRPLTRDALLAPVEVRFVAAPHTAVTTHLPFWLLPARVLIHERLTGSATVNGLLRAFLGADGGAAGTPDAAYFVIPAFALPLATAVELTRRYSAALPGLGQRLGERLLGGSLSARDAQKLAHYALIATEVARPDLLRALRYEIHFGEPCLLGVPFVEREGQLVDACFGVAVGPTGPAGAAQARP